MSTTLGVRAMAAWYAESPAVPAPTIATSTERWDGFAIMTQGNSRGIRGKFEISGWSKEQLDDRSIRKGESRDRGTGDASHDAGDNEASLRCARDAADLVEQRQGLRDDRARPFAIMGDDRPRRHQRGVLA